MHWPGGHENEWATVLTSDWHHADVCTVTKTVLWNYECIMHLTRLSHWISRNLDKKNERKRQSLRICGDE